MSTSPPRCLAAVLEAAVALNNQGAAAAVAAASPDQWRNHTVGATAVISNVGLPYFEQAVVLLRTTLSATASFTQNETNDSSIAIPEATGPTVRSYTKVVVLPCPAETNYLCSANHNCADDGGYFVFLRPLSMALTTNAPTTSHEEFCATGTTNVSSSPYQDYCAMESVFYLSSRIILFNMALMWHAAGMKHAPGHAYRQASWTKAGQIYDMLLRCPSTDKASESGHSSILLPALYCLTLNNRAALHFQQQEHVQYHECLLAMRRMLPLALVRQRPTTLCGAETMLHPEEKRELLCNVLLLDAPLNACPAVAA